MSKANLVLSSPPHSAPHHALGAQVPCERDQSPNQVALRLFLKAIAVSEREVVYCEEYLYGGTTVISLQTPHLRALDERFRDVGPNTHEYLKPQ